MISVINFPPENRYLLDGNNTPITVTSDNVNGYFRAKIYIDDVLFDEQGWSRKAQRFLRGFPVFHKQGLNAPVSLNEKVSHSRRSCCQVCHTAQVEGTCLVCFFNFFPTGFIL